jgi:hypothetical protein
MYLNGKLDNEINYNLGTPQATRSLTVGQGFGGCQGYFNGIVDQISIYNRTLSPEEIWYLYTNGKPVGAWRFDEGSGTTAYDTSGQGNHGSISGATWTTGKFGKALQFDGADDYIISTSVKNYPYISVSVWIKITSRKESQIVSKWDDYSGNYRGWLLFQTSSGNIRFYVSPTGSTWDSVEDPLLPPLNEWIHYVGTYDGNEIKIYRNGVLVVSKSYPGTIFETQANFLIGIGKEGTTYRSFNGIIDEVKIYPFALTPQQIRAEFVRGAWRVGR